LNKPGRKYLRIGIIHKLWKQGLDFIEDFVAENLTEQKAFEIEAATIKAYGLVINKTGILANLSNGGEGPSGMVHSDEARRQISETLKSQVHWWKKGRTASKETKDRMSKAGRGKPKSDEHRGKIAEAHRGKTLSAEHIRKLSEAKKGKPGHPQSEESRKKISNTLMGHPYHGLKPKKAVDGAPCS
jgi:hypothetical protein